MKNREVQRRELDETDETAKKVPRWHKPRKRANKRKEGPPAGASFRQDPPGDPMLEWSVKDAAFKRRRGHG